MKDLTNDFIDKFLKKVEMRPVRAKDSTYYILRHSKHDTEELIAWIARHVENPWKQKFTFDIFKIQRLLNNEQKRNTKEN